MDIFFKDPTAIPLPPDEVRIKELRAEPWPDNRRVRIYLEITPFQKRPNGEIIVRNPAGVEVAQASIIETISPRMEITLHLRGELTDGNYSASASIYYVQKAEAEEEQAENYADPKRRIVVDTAQVDFSLPISSE